ncbi:hypothetical protein JTB14_028503 [Gonioctena quinquepunctata]|nr:hypothetical protein JTB14_028503 [Gonioctena quinquepunctata]
MYTDGLEIDTGVGSSLVIQKWHSPDPSSNTHLFIQLNYAQYEQALRNSDMITNPGTILIMPYEESLVLSLMMPQTKWYFHFWSLYMTKGKTYPSSRYLVIQKFMVMN